MENIFIPSKNRVKNANLLNFCDENNYKINLVIEPQDYNKYKEIYKKFNYILLDKNNMGITYARNFIKQYTENNKLDFYWQLDDDLTGLFYRQKTKLIRSGLNILNLAAEQFLKNNISLGGLEYRQYAWSANKDLIENSFCDSCVFVNNKDLMNFRYRDYVEGKEDRDFAMQVIKSGFKTGRTTLYSFSAPANGSNNGGLKEIFYDLGKEKICVDRMIELWGGNICSLIVKENGRNDVKINWKEINNKQINLF